MEWVYHAHNLGSARTSLLLCPTFLPHAATAMSSPILTLLSAGIPESDV